MAKPAWTINLTYHLNVHGSHKTGLQVLSYGADAKNGPLSSGTEVNFTNKVEKIREAYGYVYYWAEAHYDHVPTEIEKQAATDKFMKIVGEQCRAIMAGLKKDFEEE